jgi:hypothetical protein
VNQVAIEVANAGVWPILQGALVLPLFERDGTSWAGLGAGLLFASEFVLMYLIYLGLAQHQRLAKRRAPLLGGGVRRPLSQF